MLGKEAILFCLQTALVSVKMEILNVLPEDIFNIANCIILAGYGDPRTLARKSKYVQAIIADGEGKYLTMEFLWWKAVIKKEMYIVLPAPRCITNLSLAFWKMVVLPVHQYKL